MTDRSFLALDQSGFFQIRPPGQDEVRPVAVAVNVDRREAELDPMDPEELVGSVGGAVGAGAQGAQAPTADALRLRREDQERRQSLWRYLLVGALGLLVLETMLSNRLSRKGRRGGRHARATS